MRETEVRLTKAPDGGYYYNDYVITEYYGRWYVAESGASGLDSWVADFRTLRDVRAWLYERENRELSN